MQIEDLDQLWNPLVEVFDAMITHTPDYAVLLSNEINDPEHSCFVQTLWLDHQTLQLEATGHAFLDKPLSPESVSILLNRGWQVPDFENDRPNFYKFISPNQPSRSVAIFLIQILRDVYQISPYHEFHILEPEVFSMVLNKKYGAHHVGEFIMEELKSYLEPR